MRAEIREDALRIELDPTLDGDSVTGVKAVLEASRPPSRLVLDFRKVRAVDPTAIPGLAALGGCAPGCRVELTGLTIAVAGAMLHQLDEGAPQPPPPARARPWRWHLGRTIVPRPSLA